MLLEILATTDRRHIGSVIDESERPIQLDPDEVFMPDRVWLLSPGVWRLANPSYVIDAQELANA
jgi:hypothetical protein